jgi:hypothetical protein
MPEFQSSMVSKMEELGLSSTQVRGILDAYGEGRASQARDYHTSAFRAGENSEGELKRDFGSAFQSKIDAADRAFKHFAGEHCQQLAQVRLETGERLGDHPG